MPDRRRRDVLIPLLLALAVILVLAFFIFRPFLLVSSVAACVALLLSPLHRRLTSLLRGRATLSAAALVLATTVVILVPVLTSLFLLARQATVFLDWVKAQPLVGPEELQRFWAELPQRYPGVRSWIAYVQAQVTPVLAGGLAQLAGGANGLLQSVLGRVTHAVVDLLLFLLLLFFLLRDGGKLKAELRPISPFSDEQERQIFDHLEHTIEGALQAVVVVPVVQGILAGIGFMIFGVPSPFLWGTAVILAATVPVVGSPLGWVPACVYLFVKGAMGPGIGLLVFCTVVVSGSDNVVKPLLLRGSARIHPLLGFLIGPVILSLVLSAIRIYRLDVLRMVGPASVGPSAVDESAPSADPLSQTNSAA